MVTILFIIYKISFYFLFCQIYTVITVIDLISWIIFSFSVYILLCLLIFTSRTFRLFISTFKLIVIIILIFIINIRLSFPKIIIILFISVSFIISLIFFRKKVKISHIKIKKRFKIILIICIIVSVSFLIFPVRYIFINPKNKAEIVFFTSATAVPNNNKTLTLCAQNDISFAVALKQSDIEEDSEKIKKKFLNLFHYNVGYYIVIGGNEKEGGFYLTIDNTDHFLDSYIKIRNLLCNIKITNMTNYPIFFRNKGFLFDAEPSTQDVEKMKSLNPLDKYKYLSKNRSNKTQIEKAQKDLNELFDVIENDRIDIGIIKTPSIHDELDNDRDYSELTGTIYGLDLNWDYSISMIYRTRNKPDMYEYLMLNTGEYFIESSLSNIKIEKEIMPLHSFYTKVSLELNSNEIDIPNNKKYIFIGTFHKEFEYTSYLKNKDYLKDIDICRHLKIEKIFIYDWENFRKFYGENGLYDIITHIEKEGKWTLILPSYSLQKEILILLALSFHDRILFYLN